MNTNLTGTEYEFEGDWETTKYGRQFSFVRGRLLTNELFYFLSKVVKGLGDKLARDLIDRPLITSRRPPCRKMHLWDMPT
jgi:hypothetical protein